MRGQGGQEEIRQIAQIATDSARSMGRMGERKRCSSRAQPGDTSGGLRGSRHPCIYHAPGPRQHRRAPTRNLGTRPGIFSKLADLCTWITRLGSRIRAMGTYVFEILGFTQESLILTMFLNISQQASIWSARDRPPKKSMKCRSLSSLRFALFLIAHKMLRKLGGNPDAMSACMLATLSAYLLAYRTHRSSSGCSGTATT